MKTLAILASGDDQLHAPSVSSTDLYAIKEFQQELAQTEDSAQQSATAGSPSSAQSTLSGATGASGQSHSQAQSQSVQSGGSSQRPPSQDVALTTSSNPAVATNARAIVALGQSAGTVGWVFLGDALDTNGGSSVATAKFEDGTETTSAEAPVTSGDIITCTDSNLRAVPWDTATGQLGHLVTIVPRGTTLMATDAKALSGIGLRSNEKIHAWWSFVTVKAPADAATVATACKNVPADNQ
jgi:hypothetical protein